VVEIDRFSAKAVKDYLLKPWNVTQRMRRMNRNLDHLVGQKAAGKRGKGWVLTTFLRKAWGSTKEEISINMTQNYSLFLPYFALQSLRELFWFREFSNYDGAFYLRQFK